MFEQAEKGVARCWNSVPRYRSDIQISRHGHTSTLQRLDQLRFGVSKNSGQRVAIGLAQMVKLLATLAGEDLSKTLF